MYPFDVFPGFWEWLDKEQSKGIITSIKPIFKELSAGNDDLSQWSKDRKDEGWFLDVDDSETQINWV